jgi:hypothetical protein
MAQSEQSSPEAQALQRKSFERMWAVSEEAPESSVRKIGVYDYYEMHDDCSGIWYNHLPDYRQMRPDEVEHVEGSGVYCEFHPSSADGRDDPADHPRHLPPMDAGQARRARRALRAR